METLLNELGTEESLLSYIQKINESADQFKTLVILAAENNPISDETYRKIFAQSRVDITGGIFPQLRYNDKIIDKGFLLTPIETVLNYELIHNISSEKTDLDFLAKEAAKKLNSCKSLVIWVDGLSERISVLLASVYDYFGAHINYYGGGLGRTTGRSKCVFGKKDLFQDCALLIESEHSCYTSVKHGYQLFSGPHIVNKSVNNSILEIDYTDAFAFYSNIIKKSNVQEINNKNLVNISAKFPVGIQKYDGTIIVRDPMATDGKNLLCIGDVPEDSVIYILIGTDDSIITSATDGVKDLLTKHADMKSVFIIDCINRLRYSGIDYNKCIVATTDLIKGKKVLGVFSLGEIASDGDHPLEFFTKSIVLCGLDLSL